MWKYVALLLALLTPALAPAGDKPENWLQIQSQNFTVVTNSNEKTGRRIADQFERMRSVFHAEFPRVAIQNGSTMIVLAVKDEKDFRDLEPQAYLAKGQIKLGGLFLRAPDKNYVLMRVDAEGDHPYSVIYHEYTHLLLSKSEEWMPLWMNEGLAEFYQNTDIHEKEVDLGLPIRENLAVLHDNKLLPLSTLFTVDNNSPYYHEENKGSIFYAESWALTHYFLIKDNLEKTHHLADYGALLEKKTDPVTAATQAFGDLKQLQSNLERYIRQASFTYFRPPIATEIDHSTFKATSLAASQADAVRADFLAYDERVADARSLLDRVLKEDPKNVSAHDTMGYLEFRAGHLDEARKWYEQAVRLDSQSYLAHYYFAAISMNDAANPGDDAAVESSLRAAIKLNPSFAPPFERLAAFEGMRRQNLEEAHMMALTAVSLDPANISYRVTTASVLMQMERGKDAVAVLHETLRIAKTPQETAMAQNFLTQVESYTTARQIQAEQRSRMAEESDARVETNVSTREINVKAEAIEEAVPKGPHRFLVGTLENVHCNPPGINLTIDAKGKTVALHSGNYYKIGFTALGFTPTGDLNPCRDLEGKPAKVEYVESSATPPTAYVLAIEIHK
jgi:tetratricopeptide (TPR) repeat protein